MAQIDVFQVVVELMVPFVPATVVSPPSADTFQFDSGGLGASWFIVLQLSDSGDELRDKCVKSVRVTGKVTDAKAKVYGYGPRANMNIDDIVSGDNAIVEVPLANATQIQQSKRHQVNCPNLMMHTVRVEGTWDGAGERDSIHEIVYEAARQGVRR